MQKMDTEKERERERERERHTHTHIHKSVTLKSISNKSMNRSGEDVDTK